MDIKNKVAIVTGGGGGIGFFTAQALLKNGAQHVAIFDINESKCAESLQKLNKEFGNGRASVYSCDVTNTAKFSEFYDAVVKSQKKVDILVNNSGIIRDKEPDLTIAVNFTSVVKNCLVAIERMGKHKSGHGGTIVNVSSHAALINTPILPVYAATKQAVINFTTNLREQYKYTGVRAVVVCPGSTLTPLTESLSNMQKETLEFVSEELFNSFLADYSYFQPAENVAEAIIKMIKVADPGTVWLSEENKPAYAIRDVPHYRERRIPDS